MVGGYQGRPSSSLSSNIFSKVWNCSSAEEKKSTFKRIMKRFENFVFPPSSDLEEVELTPSQTEEFEMKDGAAEGTPLMVDSEHQNKKKNEKLKKSIDDVPLFWATRSACRDILLSSSLLGTAALISFLRVFFFFAPSLTHINRKRREYKNIIAILFTVWVPLVARFLDPISARMQKSCLISSAIFRVTSTDACNVRNALVDSITLRGVVHIARTHAKAKKEEKSLIKKVEQDEKSLLAKNMVTSASRRQSIHKLLFKSEVSPVPSHDRMSSEQRLLVITQYPSGIEGIHSHHLTATASKEFDSMRNGSAHKLSVDSVSLSDSSTNEDGRSIANLSNLEIAEIASEYTQLFEKLRVTVNRSLNLGHFAAVNISTFSFLTGVLFCLFWVPITKNEVFFNFTRDIHNGLTAVAFLLMCSILIFCFSRIATFAVESVIDTCTFVCMLDEVEEDDAISTIVRMSAPLEIRYLLFLLRTDKTDLKRIDIESSDL
eukprot:GDKK01014110.1.p1 GENE.GDKK01014110.1~~GDKK01014110.1.p1  ORF type:complete len:541 (-),score=119.81 GDKK01014110.1:305-1771(-)